MTPVLCIWRWPSEPRWRSAAEGRQDQFAAGAGEDIVLRAPHTVATHARSDETHPSMLALDVDSVFDAVCRSIGVLG